MDKILITGGAGFVGANLAIFLRKEFPGCRIIALDNLSRPGSDLNLNRLKAFSVDFVRGDVRNPEDFVRFEDIDLIIDAAAEPSVLAGIKEGPKELIDINFGGTINCLELARKQNSKFIFLSTNRVFAYPALNDITFIEDENRYEYDPTTPYYQQGINETFTSNGLKSFYGASKLASELLIQEYAYQFNIPAIVNRCGVIAGPWQMGKVDQGFFAWWVAAHYFDIPLNYIGFGGMGKQVRDVLHIEDLCRLIKLQIADGFHLNYEYSNVGGGWKNSISLKELSDLTSKITGKTTMLNSIAETRPVDVRIYYTDNHKIGEKYAWTPTKSIQDTLNDVFYWIQENESIAQKIFLP
ncbi:MAG: NAD-dependent epimerase/dehydratase family protein [Saprospiraceae bacterium]|nr:NAD-dependent epimerase/dehydratase family protein [Saprospiraceae bacterium]